MEKVSFNRFTSMDEEKQEGGMFKKKKESFLIIEMA